MTGFAVICRRSRSRLAPDAALAVWRCADCDVTVTEAWLLATMNEPGFDHLLVREHAIERVCRESRTMRCEICDIVPPVVDPPICQACREEMRGAVSVPLDEAGALALVNEPS